MSYKQELLDIWAYFFYNGSQRASTAGCVLLLVFYGNLMGILVAKREAVQRAYTSGCIL